ncbi:zinc finger protein 830 [Dorcoceras hygrometricum]|uniref:Zinc finger protein 830 n=1 Tax=Dorcoceras hygrometricum TaxID=472368 RepID=A0A2Z7BTY7_9LAMI|nr:zinc finger protein 830 [Dorcoceras hygrometricum]
MDLQAKRKALFRAKLNAQKQEKQRIDSPLIRYDEHDQPVCRVCDVVIKSESLWPAHQASRKHHEAIDKLKASAAAINRVNTSKPELRQELPKSKPESHGELHEKSKPSAALPKNRSSMPPPDFFDNHEPKKQKIERESGKLRDRDSHKESFATKTQIVESFVPADGIYNISDMAPYGSGQNPESQSSQDFRQGSKIAVGIEDKQVRGALPEGFFDDKDSDLRARGITPVKPDVKDEYKEFEKLIQDDLQEIDNRLEEEEYDAAEMIEEAESVEQRSYRDRVEILRKKKMELIASRSVAQVRDSEVACDNSSLENLSSDDENDENFTVDWRAKRL